MGRDDLIRISGQSQSVVSQWLGKSSKLIKSIGKIEAAQALGRASGYESVWIAKGLGPKFAQLNGGTTQGGGVAQQMSQARPIVSLPRHTREQLMTADFSQPFELVIWDDSLAPDYVAGGIARFDPVALREPVPGRPILVQDMAGSYHVRDYQVGIGSAWKAVARNARGFDPLDSEAHELKIVAVMKGYDWP